MIVDNSPIFVHEHKHAADLAPSASRSTLKKSVRIRFKSHAELRPGQTTWGCGMALTSDELGPPLSDAAIVDRIVAAVMEQKLSAGAKLPEAALCDAFDCSRTQIRRILVVLAERGVVTLQANRGAYVAKSGRRGGARGVRGAARDRAFDRALRRGAHRKGGARRASRQRARGRRRGSARRAQRNHPSLGPFHLRLAEAAGNSVMAKFREELVARTSLIIGLYGSRSVRSCSEADHEALIEARLWRLGARLAASIAQGGQQGPARDEDKDQRSHRPKGGARVVGLGCEISGKVQKP